MGTKFEEMDVTEHRRETRIGDVRVTRKAPDTEIDEGKCNHTIFLCAGIVRHVACPISAAHDLVRFQTHPILGGVLAHLAFWRMKVLCIVGERLWTELGEQFIDMRAIALGGHIKWATRRRGGGRRGGLLG